MEESETKKRPSVLTNSKVNRNECALHVHSFLSARVTQRHTQHMTSDDWPAYKAECEAQEADVKALASHENYDGFLVDPDEIRDRYPYIASGMEAEVYYDESTSSVIKVIGYNWIRQMTPLQFIENRIILYNQLCPATPYTILGIAQDKRGFVRYLRFILRQPFVQKGPDATPELLKRYMENRFQARGVKAGRNLFKNNRFTYDDLHLRNVIRDKFDNIHLIDVIITPNDERPPYDGGENKLSSAVDQLTNENLTRVNLEKEAIQKMQRNPYSLVQVVAQEREMTRQKEQATSSFSHSE